MKHIRYIILLFVVCTYMYMCNSCGANQDLDRIRDFVCQHGEDDYSIFNGASYFTEA